MTCHQVCNYINTTGATSGAEMQKLLSLVEHLSSPPVFSGVRVTRSFVLCVCFVDSCPFVLFLLIIVLSVLRITDSDYPFGIFKLFMFNLRDAEIVICIILNTSYIK
jgi:hypothetical protein